MAENEPDPTKPLARQDEHVQPMWQAKGYHCPFCGVLAQMDWTQQGPMTINPSSPIGVIARMSSPIWAVRCLNCQGFQVWLAPRPPGEAMMIHPTVTGGPRAHVAMPEDVLADYDEARQIVQLSPRGACALLRLATEKLVRQLQPKGGDLNDRIGKLVAQGLPPQIQKALDTLRVIGGEAVHPGELDLRDDPNTATGLFRCLNVIVENQIAGPMHIDEMFEKLPEGKVAAIERRDALPE